MNRLTFTRCKSAGSLLHRGLLPPIMVSILVLFMAACSASQPVNRDQTQIQTQIQLEINPVTSEDTGELPPLHYVWDTKFSSFLAVPVDVRTKALNACEARGYDHAVMASISLEANHAAGEFTCSGSYE